MSAAGPTVPEPDPATTVGRRHAAPDPDAVTVTRDGPITTITLHRPHARNAVDGPTAAALADAFRAFDADAEASVAILHGGGGTFCAGADLKALGTDRSNRLEEDPDADGPMGPTRMRLGKPVIAAIEGHAVAGGLELALWCDLRVAARDAILGVFCRRWGVPLIDGGTVRLPRLIGESRAMDLILTGRPVDAAEALDIGLVNRLVEPGETLVAARELARQIAAFPQACVRSDRLSTLEQAGLDERDALTGEFTHGMRTIASGETLEGARRFADGAGRGGTFG
ncbi:MAG: crotonase/enoyl-CoA hydratase family protein [Solirubrobacteraceae bacterium]